MLDLNSAWYRFFISRGAWIFFPYNLLKRASAAFYCPNKVF